jgi:hypothetical protein
MSISAHCGHVTIRVGPPDNAVSRPTIRRIQGVRSRHERTHIVLRYALGVATYWARAGCHYVGEAT